MEATPINPRSNRPALAEVQSPNFSGYSTPMSSPDEFLIHQRGRKCLPVTWSPDIELKRLAFESTIRTPPKNTPGRNSPRKLHVTLHSTPFKRELPRKRLFLDERVPLTPDKIDFCDISTPEKFKITSPLKITAPIKQMHLENVFDGKYMGPLDSALKSLSPTQLINMIKKITYKHPNIEQEIRREMPAPDLSPLEEKLCYLKTNIFKSLPSTRLSSKTDSPAYSRVAIHLAAFKKCLVEQGKILVDSQHWESVMKYVFLAWKYARATPVWDNQPHNAQRKQCFKALSNFCITALKKGGFDNDFMVDVQDKLHTMEADSDEVQSCLEYVQENLKKNN